jgi:hypothetical protein
MGVVKGKSQTNEPEIKQKAIGLDPSVSADIDTDLHTQTSSSGPKPPSTDDLSKWLKESAWPRPKWLARQNNSMGNMLKKDYQEYAMNALRWRYMRLEGDFRTVLNNFYNTIYIDKVTARRIISFLESAREALEEENCEAMDVSNLLDMADQYMVWLYPPHVAKAQAAALAAQLKSQNSSWGIYLEAELLNPDRTLGSLRAALDKAKEMMNHEAQTAQINNGLQIERLQLLIRYGVVIMLVMLAFIPMIVKSDSAIFKDTILGSQYITNIRQWVAIGTVGVIGAVGAFMSGLLQMRRTTTNLSGYLENITQFKLRVIVGSTIAMFVTALLTFEVISSLEIKNAGAYILVAFLCGFSERYFLNLLKIDEESNRTEPNAPIIAARPPSQEAEVILDKVTDNVNERKI